MSALPRFATLCSLVAAVATASACSTSQPAASSSGGASSGGGGSSSSSSGGKSSGSSSGGVALACDPPAKAGEIFSLSARDIGDVDDVSMCNYRGKVMLIFNGASYCGNTPQYRPLQSLHESYEARGFVALGFPCNQFGEQEPGSAKEISEFCVNEYGITFPLFSKVDVNGSGTHAIYKWLKAQPVPQGDPTGDVTWNFEKFLIGRDGKVARRFAPGVQPDAPEVVRAIEAELAKPVPKLK
jgi:glutathione peroxidase